MRPLIPPCSLQHSFGQFCKIVLFGIEIEDPFRQGPDAPTESSWKKVASLPTRGPCYLTRLLLTGPNGPRPVIGPTVATCKFARWPEVERTDNFRSVIRPTRKVMGLFLRKTGPRPYLANLADAAVYPPSLDVFAKRRDIGGHACKRGKEDGRNFVTSSDCALAAKMMSLLCICIWVATT